MIEAAALTQRDGDTTTQGAPAEHLQGRGAAQPARPGVLTVTAMWGGFGLLTATVAVTLAAAAAVFRRRDA